MNGSRVKLKFDYLGDTHTVCVGRNDFHNTGVGSEKEFPYLIQFWSVAVDEHGHSKISEIYKKLQEGKHKVKRKTCKIQMLGPGSRRYCIFGTNASRVAMKKILEGFFKNVRVDTRQSHVITAEVIGSLDEVGR